MDDRALAELEQAMLTPVVSIDAWPRHDDWLIYEMDLRPGLDVILMIRAPDRRTLRQMAVPHVMRLLEVAAP